MAVLIVILHPVALLVSATLWTGGSRRPASILLALTTFLPIVGGLMAWPWAASQNAFAQILVVGYLLFESVILRLAILAARGARSSCYWWGLGDQTFIVVLALLLLYAVARTSPFVGRIF